jgi:hypothetical protein
LVASGSVENEVILAEEQDVLKRQSGLAKHVEAIFGGGDEVEGTLVLTNKRLIFVASRDLEQVIGVRYHLVFSDVEDITSVSPDPPNASIPLDSIKKIAGHKGEIGLPSLEVQWIDPSQGERNVIFHQRITDTRRKRNLNDWAVVIQRLKSGEQKFAFLPPLPSPEKTLEGKVLYVLNDMQEKGVFRIEKEIEDQFKIDADPDEVEEACRKLVASGFIDVVKDPAENFYRRRSPLGEDDLSS